MISDNIRKHPEVLALLERGNYNLGVMGFTDHSMAHCALVADRAAYILKALGYSEQEQELARIAGLMHDIGNAVNRKNHAEYGAILANDILKETELSTADRLAVVSAIGNHDESTAVAVNPITAALILADKTDVRASRVRNADFSTFDIHDRVNYAVTGHNLKVDPAERKIALNLQIDESVCTMYEYFDIFLGRMMMCREAAQMLGAKFRLTVNGGKVL